MSAGSFNLTAVLLVVSRLFSKSAVQLTAVRIIQRERERERETTVIKIIQKREREKDHRHQDHSKRERAHLIRITERETGSSRSSGPLNLSLTFQFLGKNYK